MHTLGKRLGLRLDEHQREIQVAGEWQTAALEQQMERLTRDLQQLSARVLAFQTQQNQDRSHEGHEGGD